jgi:hypothetical protein
MILVLIHNLRLVQLQTRNQSSSTGILQPRSTNGHGISGPVCSDWYYQLILRFHSYLFSAAISTSIFLLTMTREFIISDIFHNQLIPYLSFPSPGWHHQLGLCTTLHQTRGGCHPRRLPQIPRTRRTMAELMAATFICSTSIRICRKFNPVTNPVE